MPDSGFLPMVPRVANRFVCADVRHSVDQNRQAVLGWLQGRGDRMLRRQRRAHPWCIVAEMFVFRAGVPAEALIRPHTTALTGSCPGNYSAPRGPARFVLVFDLLR